MHNNLIPADGGVSGSGGASGDAGFISPSPDASADRAADVLGSTGGTGGRDGAAGAGGSINPGLDASPDLFADVSASVGGIGGGGGISNTGAIVGAGGVTSAAGIIGAGGVTGGGGTPATGGSTSSSSDASASPPADAAGSTGDTRNSGDAPRTGGATNDGATSDTTFATWADGPSASDSGAQVDAPRFITSFTASATTISIGSSVTIAWTVGSGATLISIDNGIGMVTPTGSRVVFPTQTTTYILTAADGAGHYDTAQVTVTVMPIDASVDAPVGGAGGAGGSGGAGGTDGGLGGAGGIGGIGGFSGGLGGAGGSSAGLPVIDSFVAGASYIAAGVYGINTGHATTLTATFHNATSAKVDPGFPSVTSGVPVATANLTANTIYTLTVTNAVGYVTATLTVEVFPPPVTVASTSQVCAIAVDSSNVYWSTFGYPGSVMKVSSAGGDTPVTLASTGAGYSCPPIAIDSSNVYWTNYSDGTVMTVGLGGGDTPTTLASGQYFANAIAVDSSGVYWTTLSYGTPDGGTNTPVQGTGSVMKVGLGGSGLTTLASGQDEPSAIAVDASNVYWNGSSSDIGGMLMKVGVAGGDPSTLAVGLTPSTQIAVDASSIYWFTPTISGLQKIPLTDGAPVSVAGVGSGPGTGGFVIDNDTNVYWLNWGNAYRTPLVGGISVMLSLVQATGYPYGGSVAVDATSVYWSQTSNGSSFYILKVAK